MSSSQSYQNFELPEKTSIAQKEVDDSETIPLPVSNDAKDGKTNNNEEREQWGHKAEFILASIGLAVGLGNVWRFPYLCQKNGGGAFLIPYFIMMLIEGIPLFYIEFAIGQRFKRTAVGCFATIHPALKGIGISSIFISILLCVYYVAVIAWCFYYLFASFTSQLPWRLQNCDGYATYSALKEQCEANRTFFNESCANLTTFPHCCVRDPQLYFFYNKALRVSPSIGNAGSGMNWEMFGCLVLAWVIVYACIVKGVQSSGKVVYFTATFPYVVLIILFCAGVSLEGAGNGIKTLFKPDFTKLTDPEIWMDAATQMFFTLSLGFGALISFASYMPIKNNCVRDAYTVVFINCGTSIFAGIVVFSILGHREFVLGEPANKVGGGPGLAFITFCDAFLQMPVGPLWSILFFIMLILLGIDSEFGTLEGAIAPFYDMKWITMRKELFTAIMAVCMFLVGIALVTPPGFYIFQIFDDFAVSLSLLFVAFFQTIAVAWVYGTDKFANDVEYMTGKRPYFFWMLCWKYISPLAIFIIFVANCHKLVTKSAMYKVYVGCSQQLEKGTSQDVDVKNQVPFGPFSNGTTTSTLKVHYPDWAQFAIVLIIAIPMAPTLIYLAIDLFKNPTAWKTGFQNRLTNLIDYHPDPYRLDFTRRQIPDEFQTEQPTID